MGARVIQRWVLRTTSAMVSSGSTPLITELLRTTLTVGAGFAPFVGLLYPLCLIAIGLILNPFINAAEEK